MRKEKNGRRIPSLVRKYGEPLFKSVFDVWGVGTDGHVDGNAHATITMYGDDFKDCKRKLEEQTDRVYFQPKEIVDLNPEYSKAYDAIQKAHKEFAKKFAVIPASQQLRVETPAEGAVA